MTIEPFPWFEGSQLDMDQLYTELTLEKIERMLLGEETWTLQTYEDMFNFNESQHEFLKVLMKADPGMGKTTLGRKLAKDWATGVFQKFSIVFFVALKLVKPNDRLENAILQQYPVLKGLKISEQKLLAMLDKFSNKVLIILDGLDERSPGQDDDVLKTINKEKFLGCAILVSSRPHSTWGIEEDFSLVVRAEGFTEKEARKFVQKFFPDKHDKHKIEEIMEFQPADVQENFPVHKCPILLAMLCFLVTKQGVDLSDPNISMGDLYFKMVKYLFLKYTHKKGVQFQESDLIQVMKSVGQLALRTLLSNNPLLQQSEVRKIAGDFALEYGFFAVEKDFTDPIADVYVTWAHRSIEEFFGSFGFLQALDDGKTVDEILGSDCEEPLFMVNPLVFTFCLWLLTREFFGSQSVVYDKLVTYAAQQIDFYTMDINDIRHMYPAINMEEAALKKDNLKLEFFKQVLQKCEQVRVLLVSCDGHEFPNFKNMPLVTKSRVFWD